REKSDGDHEPIPVHGDRTDPEEHWEHGCGLCTCFWRVRPWRPSAAGASKSRQVVPASVSCHGVYTERATSLNLPLKSASAEPTGTTPEAAEVPQAPQTGDFGGVVRKLFRIFKYVSWGLILVSGIVVFREVK